MAENGAAASFRGCTPGKPKGKGKGKGAPLSPGRSPLSARENFR
jgi:hypothetical protein